MDTTPEVTPQDTALVLVIEEVVTSDGTAYYVVGTAEVQDHYTACTKAVERLADHPGRYHAIRVDGHNGSSAYEVKLTTMYADQ